MGGMLLGQKHKTYENDVLVEAQAEVTHEAVDSRARIRRERSAKRLKRTNCGRNPMKQEEIE